MQTSSKDLPKTLIKKSNWSTIETVMYNSKLTCRQGCRIISFARCIEFYYYYKQPRAVIHKLQHYNNYKFQIMTDQPKSWQKVHRSDDCFDCEHCLVFSPAEICDHKVSDHNYYTVCKVSRSSNAKVQKMRF